MSATHEDNQELLLERIATALEEISCEITNLKMEFSAMKAYGLKVWVNK